MRPIALYHLGEHKFSQNQYNHGWERQFNEINMLKGVVCAACAVRNGCYVKERDT